MGSESIERPRSRRPISFCRALGILALAVVIAITPSSPKMTRGPIDSPTYSFQRADSSAGAAVRLPVHNLRDTDPGSDPSNPSGSGAFAPSWRAYNSHQGLQTDGPRDGRDQESRACGRSPTTGLDTCSLERGDILLGVRDYPPTIQALRLIGETYWFHVAIYLGERRLAEAASPSEVLPNQVRMVSIHEKYWWTGKDLLDWVVLRPSTSAANRDLAASYAEAKANQVSPAIQYNTELWNKFPEDSFYCSQLPWRAYMTVGLDLEATPTFPFDVLGLPSFLRDLAVVTPDDLYDSARSGGTEVVQRKWIPPSPADASS